MAGYLQQNSCSKFFDDLGALWHRIIYIRLWLHRQCFSVRSLFFLAVHWICDNKKTMEYEYTYRLNSEEQRKNNYIKKILPLVKHMFCFANYIYKAWKDWYWLADLLSEIDQFSSGILVSIFCFKTSSNLWNISKMIQQSIKTLILTHMCSHKTSCIQGFGFKAVLNELINLCTSIKALCFELYSIIHKKNPKVH